VYREGLDEKNQKSRESKAWSPSQFSSQRGRVGQDRAGEVSSGVSLRLLKNQRERLAH
jgi:hypothetical protein